MHISRFKVKNFKLFQDIEVVFNPTLSIFTGVNNSGKTTLLQALSLWHECFTKLIRKALRTTGNYRRNDYILGTTQDKYFDQINSVLSPNFEDIFYQRDKNNRIELSATLVNDNEEITICFKISSSGRNYVIELLDFGSYDFNKFNNFFQNLPSPFSFYYTSPSSAIRQIERFVTIPQIQESIINRDSSSVIRNRLYQLYNSSDPSLFSSFLEALSFILYNRTRSMNISTVSQIQRDVTVVFNFKHNEIDIEKDIALLGSGSLQIIEILLNLYHPSSIQKDLNLILLDEPDSHIHREIQSRLLKILVQFSERNQIFITTHNEALIRSTNLSNLFHLDGQPIGIYENINSNNLTAVNPRFSGIYPSQVNPVISALGMVSGLDFLNAIESDTLIFVEGADDAQVIDILLKQNINNHKKYVYWVLGGVSEVFKRILHYETVLSKIKNNQTLWQKSVLIIDRDNLIDAHQVILPNKFQDKIKLKSHIWSAYTFESTLFTDIPKLATLLNKWVFNNKNGMNLNINMLKNELLTNYSSFKRDLANHYDDDKTLSETAHRYRTLRDDLKIILKYDYINTNDIDLKDMFRNHVKNCLDSGNLFKLMTKYDVETVISATLQPHGVSFDVETEFIELIEQVDRSIWFDEWDFLNSI